MEEYYQPNSAPEPTYVPEETSPVQGNQTPVGQTPVKTIPVMVKIISVLYYISAGVSAIGLILLAIVSFSRIGGYGVSILVLSLSLIFGMGVAILYFFIGRGLWNGKNWARVTAIVLRLLGMFYFIFALVMSSVIFSMVDIPSQLLSIYSVSMIFPIGINAFIAGYLIFSKKVKEAFKKA
jgi:hypothetical protein